MNESPEMAWLRDMWDHDLVRMHESEWIAIQTAQIVDFDTSLEKLLLRLREAQSQPLLAFIYHGAIQ